MHLALCIYTAASITPATRSASAKAARPARPLTPGARCSRTALTKSINSPASGSCCAISSLPPWITGRDAAAFFGVFLALKLLMDLLAELPPTDAKEPPAWLARLMNRIGDKSKGDFREEWQKAHTEQRLKAERAEKPMDEAELAAFRQ